MTLKPPTKLAIYTLSLRVERPIYEDEDEAAYITVAAKRELEQEILRVLRRLDGDCDCEVLNVHLQEE